MLAKSIAVNKSVSEFGKDMKVNRPGKSNLGHGGKNPGRRANYAWLYPDLLQALQGEHFSALGSQQKGP